MAGTSVDRAAHAADDHAQVVSHQAPSYNPDAPSEAWGWHGSWRDFAPRGSRIMLWIGVAIMFLMLIGNHVSNVENYWLITIGVLLAVWLLRDESRRRKARLRR